MAHLSARWHAAAMSRFVPGLLLASFVLASACGASCPNLPHTDPASALEAHRSSRHPIESLRAEARVEQWGEAGRIRGTVMMFIERPDRVRFDAMTQFGPAATLTSDGESFALTDMRENRFFSGPACSSNIARLLGIPLSGAEVLGFLIGDSPRIAGEDRGISCGRDGHYLVSRAGQDGSRQELRFEVAESGRDRPPEEQRLLLKSSEVFGSDGEMVWRATWADYRSVPNPSDPAASVRIPFRVRFEHLEQGADTEVRFQEVSVNPTVPDGAFQQPPRPGLPAEYLECQ